MSQIDRTLALCLTVVTPFHQRVRPQCVSVLCFHFPHLRNLFFDFLSQRLNIAQRHLWSGGFEVMQISSLQRSGPIKCKLLIYCKTGRSSLTYRSHVIHWPEASVILSFSSWWLWTCNLSYDGLNKILGSTVQHKHTADGRGFSGFKQSHSFYGTRWI